MRSPLLVAGLIALLALAGCAPTSGLTADAPAAGAGTVAPPPAPAVAPTATSLPAPATPMPATAPAAAAATPSPAARPTAATPVAPAAPCPVTAPVTWRPPDAPGRDPLPLGPYFRSPDGRLNAPAWPLSAGPDGNKVLWLKPVGSRLEVRGRRLDGEAPPLRAHLFGPEAYSGDFEASGLYFPAAGCWEVEARADGSILRFVVSAS